MMQEIIFHNFLWSSERAGLRQPSPSCSVSFTLTTPPPLAILFCVLHLDHTSSPWVNPPSPARPFPRTPPQPISWGHSHYLTNCPQAPIKPLSFLKLVLFPWYLTAASVQVGDWARASSNKGSLLLHRTRLPGGLWGSRILGITIQEGKRKQKWI